MLANNKAVLNSLEGKTNDEKKEILRETFPTYYEMFEAYLFKDECPCKFWFANVFDYCHADELQHELDFFFFIINLFAQVFGFCFNYEDTVYLGCACPCGKNQVILYFTISHCD